MMPQATGMGMNGYPAGFGADILNNIKPYALPYLYIGSTKENAATRVQFGESVSSVLDGLSKEEAAKKVMVIDSQSSFVCVRWNLY